MAHIYPLPILIANSHASFSLLVMCKELQLQMCVNSPHNQLSGMNGQIQVEHVFFILCQQVGLFNVEE